MAQVIDSIFNSFWTFLGTFSLVALLSFGWALTFYWLTRYKELMQDKILRELEIARIERHEFEKLINELYIQDPFKQ